MAPSNDSDDEIDPVFDPEDDYGAEYMESLRSPTGLEIGMSIRWPPDIMLDISTCLDETQIAPMFDGTQWAGTRLWSAAIVATKYLEAKRKYRRILELGCGLGIPGMILQRQNPNSTVVLSDKGDLLENIQGNLQRNNMPDSITAVALDWTAASSDTIGEFDLVFNCDCIYEPLYGKSWKNLLELQHAMLQRHPTTHMITSVERRKFDGIDAYTARAQALGLVVTPVFPDFEYPKNIEVYELSCGEEETP